MMLQAILILMGLVIVSVPIAAVLGWLAKGKIDDKNLKSRSEQIAAIFASAPMTKMSRAKVWTNRVRRPRR